ncbi:DELLA protein GAI1-like [Hibiscus syriacus]|uniref:DELLA protein GAI1-like n=1 Tax=Hibiscus syriacus TaxID=106335 RepID=UPI00192331DC|nr:DELLA protein GAI1-like [Hibiscus syriacus]
MSDSTNSRRAAGQESRDESGSESYKENNEHPIPSDNASAPTPQGMPVLEFRAFMQALDAILTRFQPPMLPHAPPGYSVIFPPPSLATAGSNRIPTDSIRLVVLVESQENGIRLVHALMACAEVVQQNNFNLTEALVRQIGFLAISKIRAMRKAATYFAEALARKIYKLYPQNPLDNSLSDVLHMHICEADPCLKFTHFTANQAILEAFECKTRVHVIALRVGGLPAFEPPSHVDSDHLQEVGWKLAHLAETIHDVEENNECLMLG